MFAFLFGSLCARIITDSGIVRIAVVALELLFVVNEATSLLGGKFSAETFPLFVVLPLSAAFKLSSWDSRNSTAQKLRSILFKKRKSRSLRDKLFDII